MVTIPGAGGTKGGWDPVVDLFHLLQKTDHGNAFVAAQGGGFLHAGSGWGEGERVVLGAPNGGGAVDHDLSIEQAIDALGDGFLSALAAFIADKGERLFLSGDLIEELKGIEHGVIVERDLVVVTAFERPALGPAAVGVLGIEEKIDPPEDGGF